MGRNWRSDLVFLAQIIMPPNSDNFFGLQLRISAKKLGAIVVAIAGAVGTYFTVATKNDIEIEKRLTSIETKIELLLPHRTAKN